MTGRHDGVTAQPSGPALARFAGPAINDPAVFGGGSAEAISVRRRDTVAYGYLAVVEEYASPDGSLCWRVLTVSLPGRVPTVVVDHRSALGRPGVTPAVIVPTGDAAFDAAYTVLVDDPEIAMRVLAPRVREGLLAMPVQRFELGRSSLRLRSFDAAELPADLDGQLAFSAGTILSGAPSFVVAGAWFGSPGASIPVSVLPTDPTPLLPGLNGTTDNEPTPEELERAAVERRWVLFVALAALVVAAAAVVVIALT